MTALSPQTGSNARVRWSCLIRAAACACRHVRAWTALLRVRAPARASVDSTATCTRGTRGHPHDSSRTKPASRPASKPRPSHNQPQPATTKPRSHRDAGLGASAAPCRVSHGQRPTKRRSLARGHDLASGGRGCHGARQSGAKVEGADGGVPRAAWRAACAVRARPCVGHGRRVAGRAHRGCT